MLPEGSAESSCGPEDDAGERFHHASCHEIHDQYDIKKFFYTCHPNFLLTFRRKSIDDGIHNSVSSIKYILCLIKLIVSRCKFLMMVLVLFFLKKNSTHEYLSNDTIVLYQQEKSKLKKSVLNICATYNCAKPRKKYVLSPKN